MFSFGFIGFLLASLLAHPASANKCVISGLDITMEPGETYNSREHCMLYSCEEDFQTRPFGCAIPMVSSECTVIGFDLDKFYPECCPKVVCPSHSKGF